MLWVLALTGSVLWGGRSGILQSRSRKLLLTTDEKNKGCWITEGNMNEGVLVEGF